MAAKAHWNQLVRDEEFLILLAFLNFVCAQFLGRKIIDEGFSIGLPVFARQISALALWGSMAACTLGMYAVFENRNTPAQIVRFVLTMECAPLCAFVAVLLLMRYGLL